ncbi:MAG TPA: ATP-binding domain-containing protein, partial [Pseudonocardiaceae bacterium]
QAPAGARSWDIVLSPYVRDRWQYHQLTINYRTPTEIMAVAADVLAELDPALRPPDSVRANGFVPWSRRVDVDELEDAVRDGIAEAVEGTVVVIAPDGVSIDIGCDVLTPRQSKGLEFDTVVVVEPDRILAGDPRGAADLYVALTRATQRLGVIHTAPLPAMLRRLSTRYPVSSPR